MYIHTWQYLTFQNKKKIVDEGTYCTCKVIFLNDSEVFFEVHLFTVVVVASIRQSRISVVQNKLPEQQKRVNLHQMSFNKMKKTGVKKRHLSRRTCALIPVTLIHYNLIIHSQNINLIIYISFIHHKFTSFYMYTFITRVTIHVSITILFD